MTVLAQSLDVRWCVVAPIAIPVIQLQLGTDPYRAGASWILTVIPFEGPDTWCVCSFPVGCPVAWVAIGSPSPGAIAVRSAEGDWSRTAVIDTDGSVVSCHIVVLL